MCSGDELELFDCSHTTAVIFCFHFEDAGVICPPTTPVNCTTGALRLQGGENQYEGRVEVCLHGRWGTVCDDLWDGRDAAVVCRQLGYTENGYPFGISQALFGEGEGFIVLDSVECLGNEPSLLSCRAMDLGDHNCFSAEDASVFCPCKNLVLETVKLKIRIQ